MPIGWHYSFMHRDRDNNPDVEPPPPPGSTPTLLGSTSFNPSSPTWWTGDPITGIALANYNGLIWWLNESNWSSHQGINSSSDGGLDDLARTDNLYHLGRLLRERLQVMAMMLALTGDLRFLDGMVRVLDLADMDLAVGYRDHNTDVVTWPASPYKIWVVRGSAFPSDQRGTDLSTMNEVKWHATIAQITYALYLNRENTSPAGYNYEAKYNYWISYLTDHFLPKWRGGDTTSWRAMYKGVRRDPYYSSHHRAVNDEWPIVVNGGEGHSSVSSTHLAYYMWKLTGEETAMDEFEWMTAAWLDVDCKVINDTHRVYYHTSPAQGSSATYAQRSAYVNFNQMDMIVGRVLGMWPERINDTVLTQMANSFNDYFLLPNFTSISSTSSKGTRGDIVGEVERSGMTSSPDTGRTMMQLIVNGYFPISRWAKTYTNECLQHLESFSASGTTANPKVPFLNFAHILKEAPL